MSWLIFKMDSSNTARGRELIMPRRPEGSSVRMVDNDPRHHAKSLEEAIRALNPPSGYEYVCYEVNDHEIEAMATRPPTPPIEILISNQPAVPK